MSISDHDTVAAYPGACESGRKEGVEIIPSVELTTLFDGREFHLLLPLVDWESEVVGDLVARATGLVAAKPRSVSEAPGGRVRYQLGRGDSESESMPPLGVNIAQILIEKAARTGKQKTLPQEIL